MLSTSDTDSDISLNRYFSKKAFANSQDPIKDLFYISKQVKIYRIAQQQNIPRFTKLICDPEKIKLSVCHHRKIQKYING